MSYADIERMMLRMQYPSDAPHLERDAHLAWAKRRALDLLDRNYTAGEAMSSLINDLTKHPAWQRDRGLLPRVLDGLRCASFGERAVRDWIEAFR